MSEIQTYHIFFREVKNMKIDEFTPFFGWPIENKEFDAHLSSKGIHDRPQFDTSPVESIDLKETGLSLIFRSSVSYFREYGEPREPGDMIFASLQTYGAVNDSGFSCFQGQLPFNLTFDTTLAEAQAIFGDPSVDHASGPNHVYVWYGYHGDTISLCFLPENKGVSFFDIEKDTIKPPTKIDW